MTDEEREQIKKENTLKAMEEMTDDELFELGKKEMEEAAERFPVAYRLYKLEMQMGHRTREIELLREELKLSKEKLETLWKQFQEHLYGHLVTAVEAEKLNPNKKRPS